MDDLKKGKAIARRYRNRRIGEFLKEIDLSEKKSTGITKILNILMANGSPAPEFKTDSDRSYMIVTIYPHEGFETNDGINEGINVVDDGINGADDGINGTYDGINGANEGINGDNEGINGDNEGINSIDEGINGTGEGINSADDGINEVDEMLHDKNPVMEAITRNPQVTILEIAKKTGLSESTIERELRRLKKSNIIKRTGSRKNGHWEVI
jgi:predicted HTH transcriptional regulator